MQNTPQNTSRNAYRYVSLYFNLGVFFANTGITGSVFPIGDSRIHTRRPMNRPADRNKGLGARVDRIEWEIDRKQLINEIVMAIRTLTRELTHAIDLIRHI